MRLFFVVSLLSFVFLSRGQSNIDVLHYKFNIELNDNNDSIYGKTEIKFVARKGTNSLSLDLSGDMFGKKKGMEVTKASVPYKRPYNSDIPNPGTVHLNDKLVITLWAEVSKDDTLLATIEYKGIPSDGLIISKNKYGHRTFFADNWPNRAHNWIPCVDDPADKASVEFIVTAPSHYEVISNGIEVEEINLPGNKKLSHWKEDLPLPTKVMVIGVADFAVDKVADVNGVPVYSWVFPENKKEGFYDYAVAKDILEFFIRYIGPYPYKKLANVQSKTIFGGMENASAIFYAENSITGDRREELLLAHEIAHQWFGDMATEKNFANLWLSEGFATYFAHIYVEAKYGTDSLNNRMRNERTEIIDFVKTSPLPVVDSLSSFMQLLNTNSYQKGSWVLHMLRRQLGDPVFQKSIRTYYETFAGKNANTRDLQKIFESVSRKNLEKFFTQWLYTADNPHLDIVWKYNKTKKNIAVTVKQTQRSGNFQFPLEILIQENRVAAPKRMIKTISKKEEVFWVPVQSKPIRFEVDPNVSLLFEGTVKEIK